MTLHRPAHRHPAVRLGIVAGVSALALAAASAALDAHATAAMVRAADRAGVSFEADAVRASVLRGEVAVTGLRLRVPGGEVAAARAVFRVSSLGLATASAAGEDLSLTDLTATYGPVTLTLPRLTATGSSLDAAALKGLFGSPNLAAALPVLERFDAARLSAPELRVETRTLAGTAGEVRQSFIYRDLTLDGIVRGRVGLITSSGGTFGVEGAQELSTFAGTFGATRIEGYDVPAVIRVFTQAAGPNPGPRTTIQGAATLRDLVVTGPKGVQVRVASVSTGEYKARPLREPLIDSLASLPAKGIDGKPAAPTPEETKRLARFAAELIDAIEFGGAEATGISASGGGDPAFKGLTLAKLRYGAIAGGRFEEFGAEGLKVEAGGGSFSAAEMSFSGLDFQAPLALLGKVGEQGPGVVGLAEARGFVPRIDGFTLRGLAVDLPAKEDGEDAGFPVKAGIERLEGRATWDGRLPVKSALTVEGLSADLPETDGAQPLRALGYERLNLGANLDQTWDVTARKLTVDLFRIAGERMGSLRLGASVLNAGPDLYADDAAVQQAAALGLGLGRLALTVRDEGLAARLAAQQAKASRTTPARVRAGWSATASGLIPAVIGASPGAKRLTDAVAKFLAAPGTLEVVLVAKSPGGVGFADYMADPNPASLFALLDVTANATPPAKQ